MARIDATPRGAVERTPDHLTILDLAGMLVWGIGFVFECLGDWQLARFKSDPANRGKVMHTGLWAYTRHPNYFGDALLWWGIFLIAAATPGGWITFFSPAFMTFVLLRLSGVAVMEPHLKRITGYAAYSASTRVFVPWFPRRG